MSKNGRKEGADPNQGELRTIPDQEIEYLRAQIAQKREHVAVLELELFNTRAELANFTEKYNARIAPLERRLARLKRQLKEALAARRNNGTPKQQVDFSRATQDKARKHEQARRGRDNGGEPLAGSESQAVDSQTEERLRTLFRDLAKRFHPDLVSDPQEKAWRQGIMSQVNEAYTHRNLKRLAELAQTPDLERKTPLETRAQEVARLKREIAYLDNLIGELQQTCRELDHSPAMQLRMEVNLARQAGHDLLSDMAANLDERIEDIEAHLAALGVTPAPEQAS